MIMVMLMTITMIKTLVIFSVDLYMTVYTKLCHRSEVLD